MSFFRLDRSGKFPFSIILAVAGLVRLLAFFASDRPLSGDALAYDHLGWSLAQGYGLRNIHGDLTAFFPPGYPIFLAVIYYLAGHSIGVVKLIQLVIGIYTCLIWYQIAKRLVSIQAATIFGLLLALYPGMIYGQESFYTEHLFLFLFALSSLFFLTICQSSTILSFAALGVLFGCCVYVRPAIVLFPLFILLHLLFFSRSNTTGEKRTMSQRLTENKRWMYQGMAFGLGCCLVATPWIIRNAKLFNAFIPLSTHSGMTLYSAHFPPDGYRLGLLAHDEVVQAAALLSTEVDRDRFLTAETFHRLYHNPRQLSAAMAMKVAFLFSPIDWEVIYFSRASGLNWFYLALLPFFGIGVKRVWKQRSSLASMTTTLLPLSYMVIISLIYYGSPRMRFAFEPSYFLVSTTGLVDRSAVTGRSRAAIVIYAGILLILAFCSNQFKQLLKLAVSSLFSGHF